jgi:hypothetical protein
MGREGRLTLWRIGGLSPVGIEECGNQGIPTTRCGGDELEDVKHWVQLSSKARSTASICPQETVPSGYMTVL